MCKRSFKKINRYIVKIPGSAARTRKKGDLPHQTVYRPHNNFYELISTNESFFGVLTHKKGIEYTKKKL